MLLCSGCNMLQRSQELPFPHSSLSQATFLPLPIPIPIPSPSVCPCCLLLLLRRLLRLISWLRTMTEARTRAVRSVWLQLEVYFDLHTLHLLLLDETRKKYLKKPWQTALLTFYWYHVSFGCFLKLLTQPARSKTICGMLLSAYSRTHTHTHTDTRRTCVAKHLRMRLTKVNGEPDSIRHACCSLVNRCTPVSSLSLSPFRLQAHVVFMQINK